MSRHVVPSSSARKAPYWSSHLRQFSRTSLDKLPFESPRSPDTVSSSSTVLPDRRNGKMERRCTVTVNEGFARDEIVLNLDLFDSDIKPGILVSIDILKPDLEKAQATTAKRLASQDAGKTGGPESSQPSGSTRYIFVVKDMPKELKARFPKVELYVAKHIADVFGMKKGSHVILKPVDDTNPAVEASHVELTFKDQYLSRSDMWRIAVGELADRTIYKGQMMLFMGTVKAQITAVFVDGRKVHSAFFGKNTRPVFRSESARYVLFIQMASEMWDFDSDGSGEIMFNKVVNGFLPALFKKWADLKVKHIVTIVLFARVEYDIGLSAQLGAALHDDYYTGVQASGDRRPYKDFYRVVVSEMTSVEWTKILYTLKREFNYFRQDISTHHEKAMRPVPSLSEEPNGKAGSTNGIKAKSSKAIYGNLLEAINMASSLFAHDYVDRDLMRTGISIIVISPGPGVFEVEYETLRRSTEALVGNGIGIDLICVPKIPLHSVPLFRYRNPARLDGRSSKPKPVFSLGGTPKQSSSLIGSYQSLTESVSPNRSSEISRRLESFVSRPTDEWFFALPQWLHVSYWAGSADDTLSFAGIALSVADQTKHSQDEFPIRCRMYDLQMRSVLETNEIETTPLHNDALLPQSMLQSALTQKRRSQELRELAIIHNRKVPEGLHDYIYGFQKFAPDKHAKPGAKSLWKELQEFDEARSRLPSSRRSKRVPRITKEMEDGTRRQLLEDASVFGTSVGDRRSSMSIAIRPASLSSRQGVDQLDPKRHSRNSSGGTSAVLSGDTSAKSKVASLKAPKLMRHISLGHRGFGIAAPKAVVAEVQMVQLDHQPNVTAPAATTPRGSALARMAPVKPSRPNTPRSMSSTNLTQAFGSLRSSHLETPSRPIHIKKDSQAPQPLEIEPLPVKGSVIPTTMRDNVPIADNPEQWLSNALRDEDARAYNSKLLAGGAPALPTTLSPTTAMSPWLTVLNPSNPDTDKVDLARLYSRWQHVFVRPSEMKVMKWKSLCSPAAVPLTTEYFPNKEQFDREYQRQPYSVAQDPDDDDMAEEPRSRQEFLRELISLRFSQGFQVVIGPAVAKAFGQKHIKVGDIFSRDREMEDGTSVFMAVGNTIHQLSCANGTEIEVTIYVRKPTESSPQLDNSGTLYRPAVRTLLDHKYETAEIDIITPKVERNWNYIDSFIAGHDDEMSESLRFWRARYVLIPINSSKDLSNPRHGDNEEEIRLEGIKYLAQQWLKHRYIPPSDRRFQVHESRKKKDPNPLDIVYKTEDPSVVIAAELETLPLLENVEPGNRRRHLITNRDQFKKSNFSATALAEAMQQPVEEGGVRMQNRRWHLRLHYNCFIGSDMTSWLLDNFEDLDSREEAEALGNSLMVSNKDKTRDEEKESKDSKDQGLFVHVEKRHVFRDGQYFYQINSEYAKPHPPSWFNSARRGLTSVPSTPIMEQRPRSRPTSIHEDDSALSGSTTPTAIGAGKRPRVVLSKVMKYDVDPRKRSYRPERIDLHYDRLHNPDNCYHIRIDWMNTTAKLIEDTVEAWARDMTRFGLRLVEVPIAEACAISEVNPFRRPYVVKLAVLPPEQKPVTYFDPNSLGPRAQPGEFFYQIALLRKFDFVLDTEAASNFPSNVDVTYSWGRPDFKHTQYIHRSGVLLAEITNEGHFLLLANRLYSNRAATAARERELRTEQQAAIDRRGIGGMPHAIIEPTPIPSPMMRATIFSSPLLRAATTTTSGDTSVPASRQAGAAVMKEPEVLLEELEAFCRDGPALEAFYKELLEREAPRASPAVGSVVMGAVADGNIPSLNIGQPPAVLAAQQADLDGLYGSGSIPSPRIGSPGLFTSASQLLRRGSVQYGAGSSSLGTS